MICKLYFRIFGNDPRDKLQGRSVSGGIDGSEDFPQLSPESNSHHKGKTHSSPKPPMGIPWDIFQVLEKSMGLFFYYYICLIEFYPAYAIP